jgi:uncharacterized protein YjcR
MCCDSATRCIRARQLANENGRRLKAPAVTGKLVCRMHGAGGGAPRANKNALKHGEFSAEALAFKRQLQALTRMSRATITQIE